MPTQEEINRKAYAAYVGKSLRLNLDGSIPGDNPRLAGVVSHVYTYGHRNMQGIDFGPDGTLYASEQGPKTDDEINILKAGSNYGWPHVAGFQDDKAYEYARWAEARTPCAQLNFSDLAIDPSVPREPESAFKEPFVEPIATMFTVPTGYNFHDPVCKGVDFICWPTVGASSIEYYASKGKGIPGWNKVLLVTTLKRGSLYVVPLTAGGKTDRRSHVPLLPIREPLSRHGREPRWPDDLRRHGPGRDSRSARWRHDEYHAESGSDPRVYLCGRGRDRASSFAWPFTSPFATK